MSPRALCLFVEASVGAREWVEPTRLISCFSIRSSALSRYELEEVEVTSESVGSFAPIAPCPLPVVKSMFVVTAFL